MKIITNQGGRAYQKVVPDEVSPIGGYYIPDTMRLISVRYGFSQIPSMEDIKTKGVVFKDGRLIAGANKK